MFDTTPTDPALEARIAALEAQIAALTGTVGENATDASNAVSDVAAARQAGDAAGINAANSIEEASMRRDAAIDARLGMEIQTNASRSAQANARIGILEGARVSLQLEAAAAISAADRAEQAAQLAAAGKGYDNIEAGRAAVAIGETFSVFAPAPLYLVTYRKTGATTQDVVGDMASGSSLAATQAKVSELDGSVMRAAAAAIADWAMVKVDLLDRPIAGFDQFGRFKVANNRRMSVLFGGPHQGEARPLYRRFQRLKQDSRGRPIWAVDLDEVEWKASGGIFTRRFKRANFEAIEPLQAQWSHLRLDKKRRIIWGKKIDGTEWIAKAGVLTLVSGGGSGGSGDALQDPNIFAYDPVTGFAMPITANVILGHLGLGQSLNMGANNKVDDEPISTVAAHPGYAKMLGTTPWYEGQAYTGFTDLKEVKKGSTSTKETYNSGMADAIMRFCQAKFGFKPVMVFGCAGLGGTAYVGLKRGSQPYQWALEWYRRCCEAAAAIGSTFILVTMPVLHGEEDQKIGTTEEAYADMLSQWHRQLLDDFCRINPAQRQFTPIMYLDQTNRPIGNDATAVDTYPEIAEAQRKARLSNPWLRGAGSHYWSGNADNSHPLCIDYRHIGQQRGNIICMDLFGPGFRPLSITKKWWVTTRKIRTQWTMDVAIEADNSRINISALGPGKGIWFHDESASPPTVESIAPVAGQPRLIDITLTAPPTGLRPRLFIANKSTGAGVGGQASGRCGIRSAQSYDTDPLTLVQLHHWSEAQVHDLPILPTAL